MKLSKKIIPKIAILTILFLVGMFFIFPPEKPIYSGHRHGGHDHNGQNLDHDHAVDEPEILSDNNELLESYLQEIDLNESNRGSHNSAESEEEIRIRLGKICEYYGDICEKIDRKHSYSLYDRYIYTVLIIYQIRTIDAQRKLPTANTLRNTISSIQMYENDSGRRGSAGTTHVRMNTKKIDSYAEFWEVFTHEVAGHIHDLGVITDIYSDTLHPKYTEFGEPKFGLNDWSLEFYKISWIDENTRRADANYKDFVSGYAMKDIFEEKAEFVNAWINHHDLLLEAAKTNDKMRKKVGLFEELFGDRYFDDDEESLPLFNANERVFDSTKPWHNRK